MPHKYYERVPVTDGLAAERTVLAAERTFLAYLRTGIALLIAGVTSAHFMDSNFYQEVGYVLIAVSVTTFAYGLRRLLQSRAITRRMLERLEQKTHPKA